MPRHTILTVLALHLGISISVAQAQPPSGQAVREPRTDRYGDPLPEGAIARLGTVRFGVPEARRGIGPAHRSGVNQTAFSADGKTVLSLGQDRTLLLWDPFTGVERRHFREEGDGWGTHALSPDGKIMASVRDAGTPQAPRSRVCLLNLETGKERLFLALDGRIDCMVFSPDGRTLVTTTGAALRFWDVATGKETRPPPATNEDGKVRDMAYSPDGKTLAVVYQPPQRERRAVIESYPCIRVFDLTSGEQKKGFKEHSNYRTVTFSPDGRLLVAGGEGDWICFFDAVSGAPLHKLDRVKGCVAFSPDGRLLAAGEFRGPERLWGNVLSGTVSVWELATGRRRCRFTGHLAPPRTLAFSPDGRTLVSGSEDTSLLVWDVTGLRQGDGLRPSHLTAEEFASRLNDLGGRDARKAHWAVWQLVSAGDPAVEYLQTHLPILSRQDQERIAGLIADLGHERSATRDKAVKELEALGLAALPDLNRTMEGETPEEIYRGAEVIVDTIESQDDPRESSVVLQLVRAVEVLEYIGSPAARRTLQILAERGYGLRARAEAQAALRRLGRSSHEGRPNAAKGAVP